MLEIAIMIEGQKGLTWNRWKNLAAAVEDLGFAGLYRSDHFTDVDGPDTESLECWTSLTWLASHTQRIEFGPLVSPVSFRSPALTARMAAAVDDLSGGRLTLGLGAGWQEREHRLFGYDLLDTKARFARFHEGVEVITRLLRGEQPVSFDGDFFQLREASLLPRPQRKGGPRILVGGNGEKRTLRLAARYADEWNAVFLTASRFRQLSARLDEWLSDEAREPGSVRRSLMTGIRFSQTRAGLAEKLSGHPEEELRGRGLIVGVGEQVQPQLVELEQAGVQRVMLQWLDLDDLQGLEGLKKATW
ncbi:MAG TPA: LLM class F420-dependent oxidoreductase [Anaerolineales bacterium]|nr:LLM class F420-dependent oxidoreductase [Anaerolineales bacterium]